MLGGTGSFAIGHCLPAKSLGRELGCGLPGVVALAALQLSLHAPDDTLPEGDRSKLDKGNISVSISRLDKVIDSRSTQLSAYLDALWHSRLNSPV